MSPAQVEAMSYSDFCHYYQYIDIIQARESLRKIDETSFPKMKDKNRKDYARKLRQQAVPYELDERPIYKLGDKRLGGVVKDG